MPSRCRGDGPLPANRSGEGGGEVPGDTQVPGGSRGTQARSQSHLQGQTPDLEGLLSQRNCAPSDQRTLAFTPREGPCPRNSSVSASYLPHTDQALARDPRKRDSACAVTPGGGQVPEGAWTGCPGCKPCWAHTDCMVCILETGVTGAVPLASRGRGLGVGQDTGIRRQEDGASPMSFPTWTDFPWRWPSQ